jgi:hypothetical protein
MDLDQKDGNALVVKDAAMANKQPKAGEWQDKDLYNLVRFVVYFSVSTMEYLMQSILPDL